MTPELGDFYRRIAYWRANGLPEPLAYAKVEAEEILESQPSGDEVRDE